MAKTKKPTLKTHIESYKQLFTNPKQFFKSVKKEHDWHKPFLFLLAFLLIETVILFLVNSITVLSSSSTGDALPKAANLTIQGVQSLIQPVLAIVFVFALTAILYYLIKFVDAKNPKFWQVFKIAAYSRTIAVPYGVVSALFVLIISLASPGTIPTFGSTVPIQPTAALFAIVIISGLLTLAAAIHTFYAMISGVMEYDKATFWKSLALVLLSSIIVFAIVMFISVTIITTIVAGVVTSLT